MKIVSLLLAFLILAQFAVAGNAESYLNTIDEVDEPRLPHRPYDEHLIENYDQQIESDLYSIINDTSDLEKAKKAFYAVGVVGSVMPDRVQLSKVVSAVETIESSSDDFENRLSLLSSGYQAIGRFGTAEARNFLLQRVNPEFSAPNIPDKTVNVVIENSITETSEASWKESIHSAALSGLVALGQEEDLVLLNQLRNDINYEKEPSLARAIEDLMELHPHFASRHLELLAAFPKSLDLQTNKVETTNVESAADHGEAKNTSELPGAEVAQESTAPEPETEKPAEVKTPEPAEGSAEETSLWWLWLIGALIVGAGFLIIRSRK